MPISRMRNIKQNCLTIAKNVKKSIHFDVYVFSVYKLMMKKMLSEHLRVAYNIGLFGKFVSINLYNLINVY